MLKKKISRIRISPSARAILGVLGGISIVTALAVFPGLALAVGPFLKKKSRVKQVVKRNLDSLIRTGLVREVKGKNGIVQIELTKRGRFEALLSHGSVTNKKQKWDGLWRVVIFDVPNTKTKVRNELRRAMRLYGFISIQKSVWVYPFPCDDFIVVLKSHLGVSEDVLYMNVSYIENDTYLHREFDL